MRGREGEGEKDGEEEGERKRESERGRAREGESGQVMPLCQICYVLSDSCMYPLVFYIAAHYPCTTSYTNSILCTHVKNTTIIRGYTD